MNANSQPGTYLRKRARESIVEVRRRIEVAFRAVGQAEANIVPDECAATQLAAALARLEDIECLIKEVDEAAASAPVPPALRHLVRPDEIVVGGRHSLPAITSCLREDIDGALKQLDAAMSSNVAELAYMTAADSKGSSVLRCLTETAIWLAMAKSEIEVLESPQSESEAAE